MTTPLPDAAPTNWVDRFAPAAWRPWLKLGRLDRPTGIWLLMLPGWQGIALAGASRGEWPDLRLLALFAPGAALMRAAGCAFNDIVDRDIDAQVARTAGRPIAIGPDQRRRRLGVPRRLRAGRPGDPAHPQSAQPSSWASPRWGWWPPIRS